MVWTKRSTSRVREKWMDSGSILEMKQAGFAVGLSGRRGQEKE